MISLRIENLTKTFGNVAALRNIHLRIESGEIFFLLGPSGCGKTTLLRCIAGFYIPESGRIFFGDDEVTRVPPHLRQTGMMFQSYALWPHLNVSRNVAFGLEERKIPAKEIAVQVQQALESVQMANFATRSIHQLSGGQQQRIALARALVIRPRCLLLDEPLSNLDTKLRLEMRTEIRRICKEHGLTAIYVTHDQKEALSIADRMAVMESGEIRQIGTPAEIYRHPKSKLVAGFMGETNFLSGKITEIHDGTMLIETAVRTFAAHRPKDSPLQLSDSVTVSIRPESWKLSINGNAPNQITGTIKEQIYLGEMAQYRFVSGSTELKVYEINPRLANLSEERTIQASVDPTDVIAIPDKET